MAVMKSRTTSRIGPSNLDLVPLDQEPFELQAGTVKKALGGLGGQRQRGGDFGVGTVLELVHFQGGALALRQARHGSAHATHELRTFERLGRRMGPRLAASGAPLLGALQGLRREGQAAALAKGIAGDILRDVKE